MRTQPNGAAYSNLVEKQRVSCSKARIGPCIESCTHMLSF